MSVEFKELTDKCFINEYVKTHKEIFNLSDLDAYPPSFFSLLIRKENPLGIVIGCYVKNELKGLAVGIAGLKNDSLYIPFAGISKELRGTKIAFDLIHEIRKKAFEKGFHSISGIFDPLEANLGKMYSYLGATFFNYIDEAYQSESNEENGCHKIIFECHRDNYKNSIDTSDLPKKELNNIPVLKIAGDNYPKFLYEIPNNFEQLRKYNPIKANELRNESKHFFSFYLNKHNYFITKCFSCTIDNQKRTFYLFEN